MTLKDYFTDRIVNPLGKTKTNIGFAVGQFSAGLLEGYLNNNLGDTVIFAGIYSGTVQGGYYHIKDLRRHYPDIKKATSFSECMDLVNKFIFNAFESFSMRIMLNTTKGITLTALGVYAGAGLRYLLNNSS